MHLVGPSQAWPYSWSNCLGRTWVLPWAWMLFKPSKCVRSSQVYQLQSPSRCKNLRRLLYTMIAHSMHRKPTSANHLGKDFPQLTMPWPLRPRQTPLWINHLIAMFSCQITWPKYLWQHFEQNWGHHRFSLPKASHSSSHLHFHSPQLRVVLSHPHSWRYLWPPI